MVLSAELNEYLQYIVKTITRIMPVTAIYLFGSYAKGTYNEHSDLDLFVVTPDKSKRQLQWMTKLHGAIQRKLRIPIDILVNYDDDFEERKKGIYTIEREVIDTGVKLYE